MEAWQDSTIIGTWILIFFLFTGTLALCMLLLVRSGLRKTESAHLARKLLELEHAHELMKVQIEAGEQEKQRIASDLHDHFGISLSALRIKVRQFEHLSSDNQAQFVADITDMLDKNMEEMRDLSHGIYPPMLKEWGILPALQEIASNLSAKTRLEITAAGGEPAADESTLLHLFRICQEFINNSVKHGSAEQIVIHFRSSSSALVLFMKDNGRGFESEFSSKGAGHSGFEKRSSLIGATIRLRSVPGKGTFLLLIKPLS